MYGKKAAAGSALAGYNATVGCKNVFAHYQREEFTDNTGAARARQNAFFAAKKRSECIKEEGLPPMLALASQSTFPSSRPCSCPQWPQLLWELQQVPRRQRSLRNWPATESYPHEKA